MSAEEAQVYVRLLSIGPARASQVAAGLRVSRPRTYQLLKALMAQGLVSQTLERPTRFEAAPPVRVAEEVVQRLRSQLDHAEHLRTALPQMVERARPRASPGPLGDSLTVLEGSAPIALHVERLLQAAQRDVRVVHAAQWAMTRDWGPRVWDHLRRKAEQGTTIRLLTGDGEDGQGPAPAIERIHNMEIRRLDPGRAIRFLVVDGEDLVLQGHTRPAGHPRETPSAIAVRGAGFAGPHQALFDLAWARAESFSAAGPAPAESPEERFTWKEEQPEGGTS